MSSEFVLTQTLFEVDFKRKDDINLILKRFERPLFWSISPVSTFTAFEASQLTVLFPIVAT